MNLYDVVIKLIGPVRPIGETQTDTERFKNLQEMTHLVDKLVYDIDAVATDRDRHEASIKKAGNFANKFLDDLGIKE